MLSPSLFSTHPLVSRKLIPDVRFANFLAVQHIWTKNHYSSTLNPDSHAPWSAAWCYICMGCYNSELSAIGWPWGTAHKWLVTFKGALLMVHYVCGDCLTNGTLCIHVETV